MCIQFERVKHIGENIKKLKYTQIVSSFIQKSYAFIVIDDYTQFDIKAENW